MKKGILPAIVLLFLVQGLFTGERDSQANGFRETAATLVPYVKSIHPLPDWEGPEGLGQRTNAPAKPSNGNRLKISLPVGLLAILLFFLMWKFLQSQE